MPVILQQDDYVKWLDPDVKPADAVKLLKPYPAELMESYAVSTKVNRAGVEGPDLVDPAD